MRGDRSTSGDAVADSRTVDGKDSGPLFTQSTAFPCGAIGAQATRLISMTIPVGSEVGNISHVASLVIFFFF